MDAMTIPLWLMYMQAGAYAAIMFAVLGVPQVLSGYFDNRSRRRDHLESESSAERRHREMLEERREERREDRRREEEQHRREEEYRRREEERRHQEDDRRRQEDERHRQEEEHRRREEEHRRQEDERRRQEDERRRQEFELQRQDSERRHQELIALMVNMIGSRRGDEPTASETIRAMQETIDALESENARLRRQNGGNGQTGGNGAGE